MPIVLMVIFALVYLGFYLYDNLVIQTVLERNEREAVERIRHEGNLETKEIYYEKINEKVDKEKLKRELESLISRELEKNLFITEVSDIKVELGLINVKVTYKCQLRINTGNLIFLFGKGNKKAEEKVMIYNPMKVIRSIGGIAERESGI